jgi:hypothetical protein
MPKHVSCIVKSDRHNPHERITHIGGYGWKITQEQAIRDIEADPNTYYTHVDGNSAWIEVATSRQGNKYIRTKGDDENQNNLLSLDSCPV